MSVFEVVWRWKPYETFFGKLVLVNHQIDHPPTAAFHSYFNLIDSFLNEPPTRIGGS